MLLLRRTDCGVEGARTVASVLPRMPSLAVLDIAECGIGEEGGRLLAQAMRANDTLATLTVSNAAEFSDHAAEIEKHTTAAMVGFKGRMAVMMGKHPRLGLKSPLRRVPVDVLRRILIGQRHPCAARVVNRRGFTSKPLVPGVMGEGTTLHDRMRRIRIPLEED